MYISLRLTIVILSFYFYLITSLRLLLNLTKANLVMTCYFLDLTYKFFYNFEGYTQGPFS